MLVFVKTLHLTRHRPGETGRCACLCEHIMLSTETYLFIQGKNYTDSSWIGVGQPWGLAGFSIAGVLAAFRRG